MDSRTTVSSEVLAGANKRKARPGDGTGGKRNVAFAPALPCLHVRNPFDAASFPADEVAAGGDSFPELFEPDSVAEGATGEELRHIWGFLEKLISQELQKNTTPKTIVNMVDQFYRVNISEKIADAPPWSRYHIYRYIFAKPPRQGDDNIATLQSLIELLRASLAVETEEGQILPSAENVKMLLSAIKVHAYLLEMKRRREGFR